MPFERAFTCARVGSPVERLWQAVPYTDHKSVSTRAPASHFTDHTLAACCRRSSPTTMLLWPGPAQERRTPNVDRRIFPMNMLEFRNSSTKEVTAYPSALRQPVEA